MAVWYTCGGQAWPQGSGVKRSHTSCRLQARPTGWSSHCSHPSWLPARPSATRKLHPKADVSPGKSSPPSGHQTVRVVARLMSLGLVFSCFYDEDCCGLWSDWWIDWLLREGFVWIIDGPGIILHHELSRCYQLASDVQQCPSCDWNITVFNMSTVLFQCPQNTKSLFILK